VWLSVANGGEAIPAQDMERLTQPFEPAPDRRAWHKPRPVDRPHGAEAHRGALRLSRPPTGGLTVEVVLPQSPAGAVTRATAA